MRITIPKTGKTLGQVVMLSFIATMFCLLSAVAAWGMELHFLTKVMGAVGFLSGCAMFFFITVDVWKG